jgi:hypothetical protein
MALFELIMAPKFYCVTHGAPTSNDDCWHSFLSQHHLMSFSRPTTKSAHHCTFAQRLQEMKPLEDFTHSLPVKLLGHLITLGEC